MAHLSGKAGSVWLDQPLGVTYPPYSGSQHFDVVVVGGGLAGLHSAYFLQKSGKKVAIIEADHIGRGVSGHTTAHITSEHDLIYDYLIHNLGLEKAQIYADANQYAVEQIATIVKEEQIDCDFTRLSQYLFAEQKKDLDKLHDEFIATKTLGLPTKLVTETDLPFPIAGAIEYTNQARFHPVKYMRALAAILTDRGAQIFEDTRVIDVTEEEPLHIQTDHGNVMADDVIIATHYPILDRGGFFARLKSMRSYVIGAYVEEKLAAMYDDTYDPFHYIRTQETADGPLLIVGGEDHDTGTKVDTEARFETLEHYIRTHFTVKKIAYHWSSQDNYSFDRVPFIGKYTPLSKHLYVASGFYGYGMTQSLIAGKLLTDLITQTENAWESLYTPERLHLKTEGPHLVAMGVASAKELTGSLMRKVMPGKAASSIDVERGKGKVVKIDNDDIAIYKDRDGNIHAVSAKCTHMGCTVHFNTAEKSWDCPCHGSRFSIDGDVLNSPAVKKLQSIDFEK